MEMDGLDPSMGGWVFTLWGRPRRMSNVAGRPMDEARARWCNYANVGGLFLIRHESGLLSGTVNGFALLEFRGENIC